MVVGVSRVVSVVGVSTAVVVVVLSGVVVSDRLGLRVVTGLLVDGVVSRVANGSGWSDPHPAAARSTQTNRTKALFGDIRGVVVFNMGNSILSPGGS